MIYVSTKTLGWSLDEFWRSTPRFFSSMVNAHLVLSGAIKPKKKIPAYRYIDDIPESMR